MDKHSFNLTAQPWVPVLSPDGTTKGISLCDALLNAHEIRELRDSSPLVTGALHRLLLAILHASLQGPKSLTAWKELWNAKKFPEKKISAYFQQHGERFDLFHPKYPFYQVGGFELPKSSPVRKLAQELASGNNATLFDHTTDASSEPVDPATCARWLVACHSFALGGGVGATSQMFNKHPNLAHGPLVGGAMALLRGSNLFETLMLNLLVKPGAEFGDGGEDMPAWEREKYRKPGEYTPAGYLDYLTWQSRCVRLVPTETGVCEIHYAQGASLNQDTRPREPMWFYRINADDELVRVSAEPGRALWRNSDSLFALEKTNSRMRRPIALEQARSVASVLPPSSRLNCALLALSNDQAKVSMWSHEELPLPLSLLDDEDAFARLKKGLEKAEDAGKVLRKALFMLAAGLLPQVGGKADTGAAGKLADSLQGDSRFWATLELPFKHFLNQLGDSGAGDTALSEWREILWIKATDAFEAASSRSLGGSIHREMKARVSAQSWLLHELKVRAVRHGEAVIAMTKVETGGKS